MDVTPFLTAEKGKLLEWSRLVLPKMKDLQLLRWQTILIHTHLILKRSYVPVHCLGGEMYKIPDTEDRIVLRDAGMQFVRLFVPHIFVLVKASLKEIYGDYLELPLNTSSAILVGLHNAFVFWKLPFGYSKKRGASSISPSLPVLRRIHMFEEIFRPQMKKSQNNFTEMKNLLRDFIKTPAATIKAKGGAEEYVQALRLVLGDF